MGEWNEQSMMELLPVVAWLTKKYTSGMSTSVTYEKAQELMEAVLYCIQAYDKEQKMGYALATTEEREMQKIYEDGYKLILRKVKKMRGFYNRLTERFDSFGCQCYEDTMLKGMPEFFKRYDARFGPQKTLLTLDYPVMWPMEGLTGIDAIEEYLSGVSLEQRFLGAFEKSYVERVLWAYDWNYKEQFFNLCEVMVKHICICVMERKGANALPEPEYFRKYERWATEQSKEEREEKLKKILWRLVDEHFHKNELLFEYLLRCI